MKKNIKPGEYPEVTLRFSIGFADASQVKYDPKTGTFRVNGKDYWPEVRMVSEQPPEDGPEIFVDDYQDYTTAFKTSPSVEVSADFHL